jgi:prolyl-tRNA editing enzyme YbaK/EbsC (Cys-tRNA(Pro) deacylase)
VTTWTIAGTLTVEPALSRADLLAEPVAKTLAALPDPDAVGVAEIDPERAGEVRFGAALVLATTRADVNGVIKKRLDVRKASFAPMAEAVELTGMAYGGITPVGLPAHWPLLIDKAVADAPELVIGSGLRGSKLFIPGSVLASMPGAEVIEGLAKAVV